LLERWRLQKSLAFLLKFFERLRALSLGPAQGSPYALGGNPAALFRPAPG
jgi:hypothetical protein